MKFTSKLDILYKNGMNLAHFKKQRRSHKNQQSQVKNRYYELVSKRDDPNSSKFTVHEDETMCLWLDSKDYYCGCPKLRTRRKYLVMTKNSNLLKYFTQSSVSKSDNVDSIQLNYDLSDSEDMSGKNATYNVIVDTSSASKNANAASTGILIDRETFIVEWRTQFARRLRRFVKYFQNGRCP